MNAQAILTSLLLTTGMATAEHPLPIQALERHERGHEDGGIAPLEDIPPAIPEQVQANTELV